MGNLNIAVLGAKDFAGKVGKKGTVTDMTFYDYKVGTDSFTLIEPSKYPEMDIDLTFKTDIYAPIGEAVKAHGGALVKNIKVTDRYADEAGKSITVRVTFADKTRTLTRDEVMVIANKVIAELAGKGIALKA